MVHLNRKRFQSKKGNMSNDDFVHDEIIESEVEFDDSEIVEADFDPPREVDNSKT